jgi:hypothetical protein
MASVAVQVVAEDIGERASCLSRLWRTEVTARYTTIHPMVTQEIAITLGAATAGLRKMLRWPAIAQLIPITRAAWIRPVIQAARKRRR